MGSGLSKEEKWRVGSQELCMYLSSLNGFGNTIMKYVLWKLNNIVHKDVIGFLSLLKVPLVPCCGKNNGQRI